VPRTVRFNRPHATSSPRPLVASGTDLASQAWATMRYWIRDKEKRPPGAPLQKLVRRVEAVSRQVAGDAGCQLALNEVRGQGARVEALQAELSRQGQVPVTFEVLDDLSHSPEDWLSELDVECSGPAIALRFGLHEGAALYVDAPRDMTVAIMKPFKDIHPDPGWLGQRRL
jgi:hypothetical protein